MAANTFKELLGAVFGTAFHPKADEIARRIAYTEYAGDPTNNLTPNFKGQLCNDTANAAFYIATTTAAAGWKKLTP